MKLYQIIYLLCVIVSIEGSLSKVLLGREIYQNGDKNNSDNDNNSDSSIINDDDDDNDDDNNNDDDDDKEETESPELNLSSENSSENSSETDEENSNESASRLKLSSRRSAVNSALQRRKKTSAEIDSKISKKSSHSQDISENSEDTKMTSGSHEMVRTGNKDEVSRRCFFLLPALIGAATHVASTLIKPFFRPMRRPVYTTTTTTTTTEEPTTTTRRYYTSTYSWERPTTSTTTTTTTTTQRPTTTTAATTTTTTTTTQTPTTTTDMTTAETQTSSLTTAPLLDPTSSSESPSQSESPPQTSEPPDLSTPVTESNSESKQDDSITPDEPTTETTSSTEDVERRRIRRLKKKTISRSIRSVINPLKKINSPYSYTNIHVLKFGRKKPLCPRRCCNRKRNNYKYLNCHKKRIIQWPSTKKFPQNLQTKDGDNNNNHGYRILGNNNHRIKLHHEKIQHNNNYNENKNNIVIPRVKDDCKYCKAGIKHRHDEHNSIDDVVKISKDKLKKKYDNENPYDFIVNHDHPHHSHFINPENIRITQTDKLNMAKIVTEHVMQGLPPDMKNESWAIDLVKRIVQDKLNEDNHDKSDVDLQSNKSDENGKKELGDDVQQDDYYQPSAENQGQHGQAYQQPEYNRPGYYQQQPPYYPPIYPPPPPWYNYPPYRGDYDDDCDDSYQRKRIRALRRDRIESDDSYEENEKSSNAYKYGDSEFVIKVEKEKSCKCLAPINETTRTDYTLVDGVGWMKIVEEGKTWNDARKHCVNEGANLAVIESDKEAKWIADKAPTATSTIYLGIHCHFSRNEWISVLDKSMDKIGFTQWRKGKPEYKGTSEYCGALWKTDVLLTNVECTSKFPFVCKIPIHGPCRTTCN